MQDKQSAFRLNARDLARIAQIQESQEIATKTEAIRYALRLACRAEEKKTEKIPG